MVDLYWLMGVGFIGFKKVVILSVHEFKFGNKNKLIGNKNKLIENKIIELITMSIKYRYNSRVFTN